MATEGNGTLYFISFSGTIAQELKKLNSSAKAAGVGKAFVAALENAVFRMRHDPWNFGEMIGRLHHAKAVVHVSIVKPLLIEFAIHEERPVVFIKRVQLLA